MRCAATRWARWRAAVVHGWCTEDSRNAVPEEALESGEGHAVVKGDGDIAWGKVVMDACGNPERIYEGAGLKAASSWRRAGLDAPEKYMWASVQTIRGCPKHCSFCSVWRTDGQKRGRGSSRA